jgi:hypothetical protein
VPIVLTPFTYGTLCHGCAWTIGNVQHLAHHVAQVALGQSRHVAKILAGVNATPPPTSHSMRIAAIRLLTVPAGSDPWHRDGWLFQTISWLAANRANPSAVIRAPHMILAHKGFDGLQLEIDASSGLVTAAVIFEDKATDDPRGTIREDVWPNFTLLEAGERENVLSAGISALLSTRPDIDADKAIENIIWKQIRRYRVSITVGATHASPAGCQRLFDGYDQIASGDVQRRRGEILHVDQLRPWMGSLATAAINSLDAMAVANV